MHAVQAAFKPSCNVHWHAGCPSGPTCCAACVLHQCHQQHACEAPPRAGVACWPLKPHGARGRGNSCGWLQPRVKAHGQRGVGRVQELLRVRARLNTRMCSVGVGF